MAYAFCGSHSPGKTDAVRRFVAENAAALGGVPHITETISLGGSHSRRSF